jgi:hypothetical protein
MGEDYPRDKFLSEVVTRYNAICGFLKGYDRDLREYLSFLIINLIEGVTDID